MAALAACLLASAWLWWAGFEVAPRPDAAATLAVLAFALLTLELTRRGRRLPVGRRISRAVGWSSATVAVAGLTAWAGELWLAWLGPQLSYRTVPASIVGLVARLFGIEALAVPGQVVVQDLLDVPAHAVSWQQFGVLPAAACLVVWACIAATRLRRGWADLGWATLLVLLWMPVRFVLVTRFVDDLGWLGAHWHPLAAGLSFFPALWLASRVTPARSPARLQLPARTTVVAAVAVAAGTALLAFGVWAHPAGRPAAGRLLVDDAHSDWEWTDIPFDRVSYGRQSTYSYVSFVDFLAHYFTVAVNKTEVLTDELLEDYDVVVLKTPTRPYLETERDAVVRFVERGGGLLLIGDHTNLFGMTTFINPMAEPFGIEFDVDDTFDLTTGQPSRYEPPSFGAHPVVVHMPGLFFETSCSIRPGLLLQPVIVGRALGSEQVDYSHMNFFGNIIAEPGERWGMFLQAAATRYGKGRVVAFTDSTVFSNFSVFFRGKPELALGMVNFLNRESGAGGLAFGALALAGLVLAAWGALLPRLRMPWRILRKPVFGRRSARAATMLAALAVGSIAGGWTSARWNAARFRLPPQQRELARVSFDGEHSEFRLPTLIENLVPDPERCYDAFFTALQRIHLFPRVTETLEQSQENSRVIVVVNPERAPSAPRLARLYEWIQAGGSLVLIQRLRGPHVAANHFLESGGLRITAAFGDPSPESLEGFAIYGGTVWSTMRPAAGDTTTGAEPAPSALVASADVGRGRVVVVLGGERYSFATMGPAFNDPSASQRRIYNEVYGLFENVVLASGWNRERPPIHMITTGALPADGISALSGPAEP